MTMSVPPDLLEPGPVKQIRIDLTGKCNLRCVYCAVSSRDYVGLDMPNDIATMAFDMVIRLAKYHNLEAVDLNGHGETTYRNGWTELCRPLHENGVRVRLQSNFAKQFSDDELESLACMQCIAISIDSADRELLKKIRRHVELKQIISNIVLVRATAIRLVRKPPGFVFCCGLYDRNSLYVEGLARLAIALDVKVVNFWNLHRHAHQDIDLSDEDRAVPLDDLADDDLRPRVLTILAAIRLLKRRGVQVNVRANFVDTLAKRVGIDV